MERRLSGDGEAAYSITALHKDGTEFPFGVHATRAVYLGRPAIIAVAQNISDKVRAEEDARRYVDGLTRAMRSTVEAISVISAMRDPYTHGHERRVGEISAAAAIAGEMGLDANRVEGIRIAGYLHDVGKISVPAEILAKPAKLNDAEFELVKRHAQQSYEILKGIDFPWPVAQVALQHHERRDGSGYPAGLTGDSIILEARILSVADVIEAMASHRPYRPGLGINKALAEIERGRGTAYDPDAADACLRLFRDKGFTIPA
jgi:HD-GYP domain-containing protein (c-di-GMP phosphodiesterase class II)